MKKETTLGQFSPISLAAMKVIVSAEKLYAFAGPGLWGF
ncbi:Uncharacterized protein AC499_4131 [Pseudomonas amygdali pv. lachrymans]|uniref:Uncharacterized protein n=1 Tax=Pseudomonas amygdali pv. lachrymans TaxID=53707 RepID=A0ABR5KMX6_PSEAV|nr:Uncharacterized protein AC499_4131 [Pseudomonas amygdali pv. lachrymans]RMT08886.1 hypothetical protein ALP54_00520 [Pseudomonas amygdali pv. lachrymans]